jgi:hypothetical protein
MKRTLYILAVIAALSSTAFAAWQVEIYRRERNEAATAVEFETKQFFRTLHPAIEVPSRARHPSGELFCNKVVHCGEAVAVSCHPESDGLLNYYDNTNGSLLMRCGGACMGEPGAQGPKTCQACPPPEWTCERVSPG